MLLFFGISAKTNMAIINILEFIMEVLILGTISPVNFNLNFFKLQDCYYKIFPHKFVNAL